MTTRNDDMIVNPQGLELQGYKAQVGGGFESSLIHANPSQHPGPKVTDSVEIDANLDANATPPALPDVNDPVATSNFSTSLTVYDSRGNSHVVDAYFVKTANPNEWDIRVLGSSSELTTPAPANPGDEFTELATGTATLMGQANCRRCRPSQATSRSTMPTHRPSVLTSATRPVSVVQANSASRGTGANVRPIPKQLRSRFPQRH